MTRTVLITGAGTGIGLASARAFSQAGDQIVLGDINLESVNGAAATFDGPVLPLQMDVTSRESVETAFVKSIDHFGAIDVVHANAGVSSMKPAIELTDDDWQFNFDVNAKGVFLTNQIAVRHFLQRGFAGIIVNTASLAAKVGAPLLAHYSASKFAVLGWTQALAREHAKDGIRVNAVCPGFVATAMQQREIEWEGQLTGQTPDQVLQSYVDQTPLGRLETAEDIADVVTFLASDAARFMTGQGINVTGGVYMG